jgi:hypothetical protein
MPDNVHMPAVGTLLVSKHNHAESVMCLERICKSQLYAEYGLSVFDAYRKTLIYDSMLHNTATVYVTVVDNETNVVSIMYMQLSDAEIKELNRLSSVSKFITRDVIDARLVSFIRVLTVDGAITLMPVLVVDDVVMGLDAYETVTCDNR